jgi:hypothetical protein
MLRGQFCIQIANEYGWKEVSVSQGNKLCYKETEERRNVNEKGKRKIFDFMGP